MRSAVKKAPPKNFKSFKWHYSYKTSAPRPDGRPVNILHQFYIPVLKRAVRYDRVAGYFRSSSLAAASQGFSAFVESGGRMRMIVGADLDEADVAAILEGDKKRLADRLNQELGEPKSWPEDVTRGVELLCWMVANGTLEVRVAFRVDGKTGKPIAISAVDDGYVHEKWAIFTDTEKNRIYISGSLNESRNALIHNAENIDVHADWWGDIEKRRTDEAETAFEDLWNDRNPHMRVVTLPEAVRENLLRIGHKVDNPIEIDGTSARAPVVAPPSALEQLRFALIKDGPKLPGGRYVGIETAPVEPWPHQEVVARRLVETWPYSYLLCDEVGLGKTIEAGLAIRSLYLSGLVRRVLIAPPASLTRQWQREMASKFFLPFTRALSGTSVRHELIFPVESIVDNNSIYSPDLAIVSTALVSRRDRQTELQTTEPFDIVLVDEAHYARRKNPKNGTRIPPSFGNLYKTLAERLRKATSCLWMATATPMQLDWIEVFDLQSLTYRVGPFQFDPSLFWSYYMALGSLVRGADITSDQWEMLRQAIQSLKRLDPFLWKYLEEWVIDGRIRNAARLWLKQGIVPRGMDRRYIRRLIFAASPMSRVMLRHGRRLLEIYRQKGTLGANLAERHILPIPRIVLSGLERDAYDDLESYCRELTEKIASHAQGSRWRSRLGFYLSFLRLRLASSLYAIRETLRRRRDKVQATLRHLGAADGQVPEIPELDWDMDEDEELHDRVLESLLKDRNAEDLEWEYGRLEDMLQRLEDLSNMPLKMKALLCVLNERRMPGHRIKQTVIFTRFYDTLKDLVNRLRGIDPYMLIGTYSGKGGQYVDPRTHRMRGVERDEIKHRFIRGEIDVLICTDAAAEGLNLQTADLLINYDLPWNPMKVEQRIGRIDRIGQKHAQIFVLNLCYADSAEQIVYERLLQRLAQAGYIVGPQQVSMLPVTREEFNDLAERKLTPEQLESRAKERIKLQRRQTESMEIPPEDLYEIYMRLKDENTAASAPVTLDSIWESLAESTFLRDLGCTVSAQQSKLMILQGLEDIPDGTLLTVNRRLFEQGFGEAEGLVHFASYGAPVFETLLDQYSRFDPPACWMRISERVPDTHAEVVAYVAACIEANGISTVRLVTSPADLENMSLDESVSLQDTDLTSIRKQLHELVRSEFEPARSIKRLENDNQRFGYAQLIFDLLIGKALLHPPTVEDADNFWSVVRELDNIISQRDQLIVPNIPTEMLRAVSGNYLFDIPVPQVSEYFSPTLPNILVAAGLDAACRTAAGMKVAKATLAVDTVKRRLDREIELCLKRYHSFI
ncbi:MAG: DEAD/DEAH box helicase family protein [Deltaproteobacteria bacterium]|nr:DEAD/DEAH box helicase family protein [Deltaproteobacteria bacterium]